MKHYILFGFLTIVFLSAGCTQNNSSLLESRLVALEATNALQSSRLASLTDRIEGQETRLETAEQKAQQSLAMATEKYAAVNYELAQIKERFLQNQGRLDELDDLEMEGSSQKDLTRLDEAISRNYERLIRLEKYMGFEPTAGEVVPQDRGKPEKTPPPAEPQTQDSLYNAAKALFDKGDFENARIGFENFINKYPDSSKADNARFWIADSYYAEKWYEKAILEYQKVLESYPDSNKSAAARLKQGYAFAQLGETANARLILNELIKRHPDSKEAGYAQEKLKALN